VSNVVKKIMWSDLTRVMPEILFNIIVISFIPFAFQFIFAVTGMNNEGEELRGIFAIILDSMFNVTIFEFGIITFVVFVLGIIASSQLSSYVRRGVSRLDYFVAKILSTSVSALIIFPTLFVVYLLTNDSVSSSHFFRLFTLGGTDITGVIFRIFAFVLMFLIGFLVATYWQRVGWLRALLTYGILITISLIFFLAPVDNSANYLNLFSENNFIIWLTVLLILNIFAFVLNYSLIKKIPVATK